MPKFIKRPVVFEAFRLRVDTAPEWFSAKVVDGTVLPNHENGTCIIRTLEGNHLASRGDFIIQGAEGELYPCKPDIFEATYDPVD